MTFSLRIAFLLFVCTMLLITGCGPEPGPAAEESTSAPPNEDVGQAAPADGALVYPETARVDQMDDYLGTIEERDAVKAQLTELWSYEKFGVPEEVGGYYYCSRNDGLQNQNVVFRRANLDGEPVLVVDPNTWSGDGTVALAGFGRFRSHRPCRPPGVLRLP